MLLAILAVSAYASALIIPSLPASDPVSVEPYEFDPDSLSRSIWLAWPNCASSLPDIPDDEDDDSSELQPDSPVSYLEFTFTVDRQPSGGVDRLLINGFEVYPDSDWPSPLRALDDQSLPDIHRIGYVLSIGRVGHPLDPDVDTLESDVDTFELLEVSLSIADVDAEPVSDMPTIVAMFIKESTGRLTIATLDASSDTIYTTPPQTSTPTDPLLDSAECSTLMCQLRQIFDAMSSKIRPHCSHMIESDDDLAEPTTEIGNHKAQHSKDGSDRDDDLSNPRDGSQGLNYHHYRRPYSYGLLFKSIATQIFLPVLIGIGTGIGLSILGMIIASIAVLLWRLLTRRQSDDTFPSRHCLFDTGFPSDEKAALKAHYEASSLTPPAYQDCPI